MKLFYKMAVSFFMAITLLSTIMLRGTGDIYLPSQSAFANQPNVIWYIMTHLGMFMAFFTLNAINKNKSLYGLTAFSSIFVLMLDMYGYPMLHNSATLLLFVFASLSIILYSDKALKTYYICACSVLAVFFGVEVVSSGLLPIDIYQIESIIEWFFTFMLLIDLFLFKKSTI